MSRGPRPAPSPWRPSRTWFRWSWPKLPWLVALSAVFVFSYGGFVSWDAELQGALLVYPLLLLTGPAGYVPLAYIPWGAEQLGGETLSSSALWIAVEWVALAATVAAGYWQWFVLFPWIRERWNTEIPVFRSTDGRSDRS